MSRDYGGPPEEILSTKKEIAPAEEAKMASELADEKTKILQQAAEQLEHPDPAERKKARGKLEMSFRGHGLQYLKPEAIRRVCDAASATVYARAGITKEARQAGIEMAKDKSVSYVETIWDRIYLQEQPGQAENFSVNEFSPGNKPTTLLIPREGPKGN